MSRLGDRMTPTELTRRGFDNVGELMAAYDAAVAGMEWISVDDRLPEPDVYVLVCTKSKNGSRNIDKGYVCGGRWAKRGTAEVTHWMPLPLPPRGDDANDAD